MTTNQEFQCPGCGSPLSDSQPEVCINCGTRLFAPAQQIEQNYTSEITPPDPDRPAWSVGAAIAMWLFSVSAILLAPLMATFGWIIYQNAKGNKIGDLKNSLNNPDFVLLFILATFGAQMATLLVSYRLVVMRSGQNFLATLGWHWHPRFRLPHAMLFTILVMILAIVISKFLPNKETDLERLLNVSFSVRIMTALIAVVSAPLVEEVIYRGILYSALRSRLGIWPAIIIVSLIFVAVHIPQYWGGWAVITSLSMLSFGLTAVRAYTGSLLPPYAIHLLFNSVNAVLIVIEGFVKH